mmetsp:Transcript_80685/g.233985  ORF Transcript_80685/g.233985 Transcript_80685/m.233985 type:complete len:190 (+) Transcript_80685:622-1191(+)
MRGEDLRLLARDCAVALDQLRHHPADGLEAEGQGRDVDQHDVLQVRGAVPGYQGGLHCSAICDGLIGVDRPARLLAEVGLDHLLHSWDSGRATDQDDLVDVLLVDLAISQDTLHRLHRLLEEVLVQLLELRPGQCATEVHAVDQRVHLDRHRCGRRERQLRLVALGLQALQRPLVAADVLPTVLPRELG